MRRIGEAVDSAPFTPPTLAPQHAHGAATPGLARAAANPSDPRRRLFDCYLFSFDCPMISAALKLMLQVGKELPTKKLSRSLEKKFSSSLKLGSSANASGSFTACGTTLPSSAEIAVRIATATCAGPLPPEAHFRPSPDSLEQSLRKPFSVSPPKGAIGCLASSIACTTPVSPPCAVKPSKCFCTAIASAVTFCAVGSSHLPTTSTTSHFLPDLSSSSWMPLWRSGSA